MAENGQKRRDGTPIPDNHIGLGPNNTSVRQTLSQDFALDAQILAELLE